MPSELFTAALIGLVVMFCATAATALADRYRGSNTDMRVVRTMLAGLAPSILIVAVLVIGHLAGLSSAPPRAGYSPLVSLIYGWWLFGLNLAVNVIAVAVVARRRR